MRKSIVATASVVVLFVALGWFIWQNTSSSIRAAFAEDQIRTFYDMVERVDEGELSVPEAVEYVKGYYPEGTKLSAGSSLSRSVELVRSHVIEQLTKSDESGF